MSETVSVDETQKVIEILQQGYFGSFRSIEKSLSMIPRKFGANWGSLSLLDQLSRQPEATVGELAKFNHVSTGAISLRISELLKQGLIELEVNPADRRRHKSRLTEKGKQLQDAQSAEAHEIAEQMLAQMSYDDILKMNESFGHLADILAIAFSDKSED